MENSRGALVIPPPPGLKMRLQRTAFPRLLTSTLALIASVTALAEAHDFWIIPHAFSTSAKAQVTLRGQTSSLFPSSVSAVTPDRIVEARVLTADSDVAVRDARVEGTSLVLGLRPTVEGQHVIGVTLAPRTVRESPASFRRYLDLEGAPEARRRYEQEGRLPPIGGDSLTRRYAKYAKTYVEVGTGRRAFSRALGHPLEIIPLGDPGALQHGDTLQLRLVMLGKPVASAKLHAGAVPAVLALADTIGARRAVMADVSIETDARGVASIPLVRAGMWNVRTIQIVPADKGSGADWDVHWATITFAVKDRK